MMYGVIPTRIMLAAYVGVTAAIIALATRPTYGALFAIGGIGFMGIDLAQRKLHARRTTDSPPTNHK